MICIARRSARSAAASSAPRSRAVEDARGRRVGSIRRSTSRPSVDLPQPDSPTSAERLAACERRSSTPSTARTAPRRAAEQPAPHREVLDQAVAPAAAAASRHARGSACNAAASTRRHRSGALPAGRRRGRRRRSRQRRRVARGSARSANGQRGGEAAAGRPAQRVRHLALDRGEARRCSPCSRGIEPSRPSVYGCCGSAKSARHRRLLDDRARRTSPPRRRPPRRPRRGRA